MEGKSFLFQNRCGDHELLHAGMSLFVTICCDEKFDFLLAYNKFLFYNTETLAISTFVIRSGVYKYLINNLYLISYLYILAEIGTLVNNMIIHFFLTCS